MTALRSLTSHTLAAALGAAVCGCVAIGTHDEARAVASAPAPSSDSDEMHASLREIVRDELAHRVDWQFEALSQQLERAASSEALHDQAPSKTPQEQEARASCGRAEPSGEALAASADALELAQDQLTEALSRGTWTEQDEHDFAELVPHLTAEDLGAALSRRTLAINRGELELTRLALLH